MAHGATQRIATSLMFVGPRCGRAEEAIRAYVDLFDDGRIVELERLPAGEGGPGVRHARFVLAGREFTAMDSPLPHAFDFTPAISMTVGFADAADLDRVHAALSRGGEELMPLAAYDFAPRFAWVQDRFGVSWQLALAAGRADR